MKKRVKKVKVPIQREIDLAIEALYKLAGLERPR